MSEYDDWTVAQLITEAAKFLHLADERIGKDLANAKAKSRMDLVYGDAPIRCPVHGIALVDGCPHYAEAIPGDDQGLEIDDQGRMSEAQDDRYPNPDDYDDGRGS